MPDTINSAYALFKDALLARISIFAQAGAASLLANLLALGAAIYSMQVYDRVIPTQGISTLIVLTVGVLIASVLELIVKMARSHVLEAGVKGMDLELSHAIFARLLGIRMDQFPASVGTLSAQLRSYEMIRRFASSATLYLLVDTPFALIFLAVIALLAGAQMAAIPAVFFVLALMIGLFYRRRIANHAQSSNTAANHKLGLLVETVESAESIKAAGASERQLKRWNYLNQQSVKDDLQIQRYSEQSTYLAAFLQQVSYIVLIAAGAWIAATSINLTMGGLIACSILSGRVLGPIAALPGLIVQWAHARAALDSLEKVFALQCDNHAVQAPLTPERIHGEWRIENLKFTYPGRARPLTLPTTLIRPGEKVAILGPIGDNFGAGFTGGMAFVYDPDDMFSLRVNPETLTWQRLATPHWSAVLNDLVAIHARETNSSYATRLLHDWDRVLPRFWQVVPKEYVRYLDQPLGEPVAALRA